MAEAGVGLREYGSDEDLERRKQIEETKRIQEMIDQQAQQQARQNQSAQSSGGNSGAGSFMSGMGGGYQNAMQMQKMMGSSGGAGGAGGAGASGGGAAGGSGGGGWGLSSMFGGGGSAAGGGAAASGGGAAASGGSAAGGTAASGMASMGPWAALAAVIIANESNARDNDYRSKDDKQYAKDLIGGKVLEQDVNQRWSKKLGGYDDDKTGMINDMGAAAEFSTFDFSNGWDKIENGTLGKIGKGIKKLF